MFGLFKKKSEVEKLQEQYKKLMEESYKLSHSNRSASDQKAAEADAVLKKIEALKEAKWFVDQTMKPPIPSYWVFNIP